MIKKVVSIFIIGVLLFCCVSFPASAEEPQEKSSAGTYGSQSAILMVDMEGNLYGRTDWPSLSAARSYYGTDRSYHSCGCFYSGNYFNYYYCFDDGTKLFFGVK